MRRIVVFICILTFLFALVACNASKPQKTNPKMQQQGTQMTDPENTESQATDSTTLPTELPYGMDAIELQMYSLYFDLEKEHRPTMTEVLAIQEGLPVSEVVKLIGKPHDFAPGHGMFSLKWETAEGDTCLIDLRAVNGSYNAQNTFELCFEYCEVAWVIPLVEPNIHYDSASEKYDEAGIFNAANYYFVQREAYLLGAKITIENANYGIMTDEDAHKLAISESGIELLHSKVVVHSVICWDSHAQAVATETVTYRANGEEKTEAIIHRMELGESDDGRVIIVGDRYFDPIANFKSCSYIEPYHAIPQYSS